MLPILVLFFSSLGIISANYDSLGLIKVRDPGPINKIKFLINFFLGICFWVYSLVLYRCYYLENNIGKNGYNSQVMFEFNHYKLIVNTEPWYKLRQCDYLLHIGHYKQAIQELEKTISITSAKTLSFSLADLYIYDKQYDKAEEQYKFIYYALPGLVEPKYRLAKFYYDRGQRRKWEMAAKEVLTFKPKIHSFIGDEMISEIRELYFK